MRKAKSKSMTVPEMIADLDRRGDALLKVQRFALQIQVKQLAAAEKLRRSAQALVSSEYRSEVNNPRAVVNTAKLKALAKLLSQTRPFHNPKARMPEVVRKLLEGKPR